MQINTVEFKSSAVNVKGCPDSNLPEFAFIGRSNVGKSSLINMLTERKHLAKTSATPGKTKLINHFIVNNQWYLVDLPGYGYAKASKENKKDWSKSINDYILNRETLYCLFVLIDCRHEPLQIDLNFIENLGIKQIPFVLVFTKSDKVSKNQLQKNINLYKQTLLKTWDELPHIFVTSSSSGTGREEILNFIDKTLNS